MNARAAEVLRITASMVGACALGAAMLGGIYLVTERSAERVQAARERRAITDVLAVDPTTPVREVRQFLSPAKGEVVYRVATRGSGERDLVFALDGSPRPASDAAAAGVHGLEPLGRIFVVGAPERPAGFVVEGDTKGYKNAVRFFVALDSSFDIAGVRVIEHEEDPGLGAEVATPWFDGQFVGRSAASLESLDVVRDPMPEDWRMALDGLERQPLAKWRAANGALLARERVKPIYAVTGATISSRALTNGVRATVDHFRRRWALIAPFVAMPEGGAS